MCGVVNEGGGTGVRAKLPGIEVCGKTGTAQLASNEFLKRGGKAGKDNAWFVGFLPREHPEIVVAALYEGGEKSYFAAALVRDVLKAYVDKKARLGQSLLAVSPVPGRRPPPVDGSLPRSGHRSANERLPRHAPATSTGACWSSCW